MFCEKNVASCGDFAEILCRKDVRHVGLDEAYSDPKRLARVRGGVFEKPFCGVQSFDVGKGVVE